jgi:deferrochelatase/peroxidase EfeB
MTGSAQVPPDARRDRGPRRGPTGDPARQHALRTPGHGEFGTYFIGYAARVWVIEHDAEADVRRGAPGAYDRLLDFSTAVTGTTFFVPTAGMLEELAQPPTEPAGTAADA